MFVFKDLVWFAPSFLCGVPRHFCSSVYFNKLVLFVVKDAFNISMVKLLRNCPYFPSWKKSKKKNMKEESKQTTKNHNTSRSKYSAYSSVALVMVGNVDFHVCWLSMCLVFYCRRIFVFMRMREQLFVYVHVVVLGYIQIDK